MQDNYSPHTSLSTSDQNDPKDDNFTDSEEHNELSESAEMQLRSVISEYEMQILKRLFPKCAQTLTNILRNRPY